MRPPYQDTEKWLFYLMSRKQHRVERKVKKQRNVSKNKRKKEFQKTELNETEVVIYLTEFKMRVIKMIPHVRKTMHKQNKDFNKEIETIRKYQTEITSRLDQMEEKIGQIKSIHIAGRYMRKCSAILIIREIQSKPQWDITSHLLEYYHEKIRDECWQGCGEKKTLRHYWWQCKLAQPLWKTIWRFLKKLKIELLYPTSRYISKGNEAESQRGIISLIFIA